MAHCIKSKEGCLPFTQATQVEILNIKIELQNLTWWKTMTHSKVCPNQLKRLKRVEKLHCLKSQPIFSEASQMEWHEPSDFPTGISRFSHVNGKYPGHEKSLLSWALLQQSPCQGPVAPNFCSWVTRQSKFFHANHAGHPRINRFSALGTFNFPQSTGLLGIPKVTSILGNMTPKITFYAFNFNILGVSDSTSTTFL